MDWHDSAAWLTVGLLGTGVFGSRFILQWVASERAGRSHIPRMFWWLSIVGSLLLLAYAIHTRNPVFIISNTPNCVIYARNLILLRREDRKAAEKIAALTRAPESEPPVPAGAVVSGASRRT